MGTFFTGVLAAIFLTVASLSDVIWLTVCDMEMGVLCLLSMLLSQGSFHAKSSAHHSVCSPSDSYRVFVCWLQQERPKNSLESGSGIHFVDLLSQVCSLIRSTEYKGQAFFVLLVSGTSLCLSADVLAYTRAENITIYALFYERLCLESKCRFDSSTAEYFLSKQHNNAWVLKHTIIHLVDRSCAQETDLIYNSTNLLLKTQTTLQIHLLETAFMLLCRSLWWNINAASSFGPATCKITCHHTAQLSIDCSPLDMTHQVFHFRASHHHKQRSAVIPQAREVHPQDKFLSGLFQAQADPRPLGPANHPPRTLKWFTLTWNKGEKDFRMKSELDLDFTFLFSPTPTNSIEITVVPKPISQSIPTAHHHFRWFSTALNHQRFCPQRLIRVALLQWGMGCHVSAVIRWGGTSTGLVACLSVGATHQWGDGISVAASQRGLTPKRGWYVGQWEGVPFLLTQRKGCTRSKWSGLGVSGVRVWGGFSPLGGDGPESGLFGWRGAGGSSLGLRRGERCWGERGSSSGGLPQWLGAACVGKIQWGGVWSRRRASLARWGVPSQRGVSHHEDEATYVAP